jgi:O-methyltransferase
MAHKNRLSFRTQLIIAALRFYSLYTRQLAAAFVSSLDPRHPASLLDALTMTRLILKVRNYTAVLAPRLAALYRLSKEVERSSLAGDIVECGVYNGGSSALIASVCLVSKNTRRNVWLFDSFEGLPPPTEMDGKKAMECGWWCHGDLKKVRKIYSKLKIDPSRVHVVKGWFHETFPTAETGPIALLHIDADWYDSVKLCLDRFYDLVQPGGYIVIDDYGHWEGCRKATDEFLSRRCPGTELIRVDYTGRYFQKAPIQVI